MPPPPAEQPNSRGALGDGSRGPFRLLIYEWLHRPGDTASRSRMTALRIGVERQSTPEPQESSTRQQRTCLLTIYSGVCNCKPSAYSC